MGFEVILLPTLVLGLHFLINRAILRGLAPSSTEHRERIGIRRYIAVLFFGWILVLLYMAFHALAIGAKRLSELAPRLLRRCFAKENPVILVSVVTGAAAGFIEHRFGQFGAVCALGIGSFVSLMLLIARDRL